MLSSRCWANIGPADVAVWAVTGGWPGAMCELFSPFEMQNISISVKTISIIIIIRDSPLSKHWLPCLKLSPVLSALCTQHCSGGRQNSNHILYAIPQEIVTLVSHRGTDKYFLLQYPFIAEKYLFSCIYLRYACWNYWCLCGNEP